MSTLNRRAWLASVLGALVAVLLVAVASSGETPLFDRYPDISLERFQSDSPPDTEFGFDVELPEEETEVFKIWEVDIPDAVKSVLQVVLIAAAVALVISAWNRRPRLHWRRKRAPEDFEVLDDLAALVSADAAAQREVLAAGSPRNAIVACWLRLEAVTEDAGFERDPSDTSEEFTTRVLQQFSVDSSAVIELAALYRRARFSSHDMGEEEREMAVEALDAVHQGLGSSVSA